jgi:hypothetical protein
MCAVCRLVCHSGHNTKSSADELSDSPSRCFCGSGSQLRLQTGRGHACSALVATLDHVLLDPGADVLDACFQNQLAGHTARVTLDFAPGVHSSLARLVVARRRAAAAAAATSDDNDAAAAPISPRTPRDESRNIEVELQRAIHASVADAESESAQRRNEQVEFAAIAAQPITPSPSGSPRVRATTSPSLLDSSHSAAHGLTALLNTLWPHLTDSTSLPIGGGDNQAHKSLRDRTTSEAVAWLDVEYALRRLRPLPASDSRRGRVNTGPRALDRGSIDDNSESEQPRRSPLAAVVANAADDNFSVRASTQSEFDVRDGVVEEEEEVRNDVPQRIDSRGVKPSEHIVLSRQHAGAAVDDRSSSLTDNFLPEVDLDMSTVSLRHKLREGSLVRELQSLKVPADDRAAAPYAAQAITTQESESSSYDVDFRVSAAGNNEYAIVDFLMNDDDDEQQQQQRVRSAYVKLTPRFAGDSVASSASSLTSQQTYTQLPLPPADSSMMQLVRREIELRGGVTSFDSPYRGVTPAAAADDSSAPAATPRRRRGAICEAQVRVDSDTGHYWAALVSTNSGAGAPLRLAFIPPKSRSIAKHGDWVLLEMNEARADGRQSAHVLRVVANAKGLPVVAVPPTTNAKPSTVAPNLSTLALAQFEAAIESYVRELNVVHLLATVPQHRRQ